MRCPHPWAERERRITPGGGEVETVRTPIASRRWPIVVAAIVTVGALLASCLTVATPAGAKGSSKARPTPPRGEAYPARVAVYGDSLAMQAEPYFKLLMAAADQSSATYYSSFGGTAICDWLPRMRRLAATAHFEAVVLEFSGNALTPCMAGIVDYTPAYYARYKTDTMAAIAIWVSTGARVFLVGAPVTRAQQASVHDWGALDAQYAQIAAADPGHVTYVDAGAAVEGPGGVYTRTLPCFIGEPCTGPVVKGVPSNVVRAPDGVHFCPVAEVDESCRVYSSGAFRFADAMVHALATPVLFPMTSPRTVGTTRERRPPPLGPSGRGTFGE